MMEKSYSENALEIHYKVALFAFIYIFSRFFFFFFNSCIFKLYRTPVIFCRFPSWYIFILKSYDVRQFQKIYNL